MNKTQLIESIFSFFVESNDFNGFPLYHLLNTDRVTKLKNIKLLSEVIESGDCTLVWNQSNPHIKALEDTSVEDQLNALKTESPQGMCIYPSCEYLIMNRDTNSFDDRPFSRELALGAPQLRSRFFELHVLDMYFSDPRYDFPPIDYEGSIYFSEENVDIYNRDHTYLKTFGIGYDENDRRVVSVHLRYLHRLSADHQQYWNTYTLESKCKLNPDYFRNSYLGEWAQYISIYVAIIEEMHALNELADLMGKSKLFRDDFKDNRPKRFGLLLHPTSERFELFISMFDKMLSQNINHEFFTEDGIATEEEFPRNDGRVEIRPIGTLRLLERWMIKYYRPSDDSINDDIYLPLKKVRRLRQSPAHRISDNVFNYAFYDQLDEILNEVHRALYILRLCFQNHPATEGYLMPSWYDVNKIVHY